VELKEVVALCELLDENGIEVWLDGGWGIDALIGEQTRPHRDLDIAVRHADVPRLRELLRARGYAPVDRPGTEPWMFVLRDQRGHEVDVHSFTFNERGEHVYGIAYPAESLTGSGSLDAKSVRCISAEWAVRFHTSYEPRAVDRHDLALLHQRLGIPVPDAFKQPPN
jgi:lincosamide nucleotidyltransferase A/C/D/E